MFLFLFNLIYLAWLSHSLAFRTESFLQRNRELQAPATILPPGSGDVHHATPMGDELGLNQEAWSGPSGQPSELAPRASATPAFPL